MDGAAAAVGRGARGWRAAALIADMCTHAVNTCIPTHIFVFRKAHIYLIVSYIRAICLYDDGRSRTRAGRAGARRRTTATGGTGGAGGAHCCSAGTVAGAEALPAVARARPPAGGAHRHAPSVSAAHRFVSTSSHASHLVHRGLAGCRTSLAASRRYAYSRERPRPRDCAAHTERELRAGAGWSQGSSSDDRLADAWSANEPISGARRGCGTMMAC